MAQQVKDPALSLLQLGFLLWLGFDPWPGNSSTCHGHGQKQKTKNKKQNFLNFLFLKKKNQAKIILLPKRHILGWQILLPYALWFAICIFLNQHKSRDHLSFPRDQSPSFDNCQHFLIFVSFPPHWKKRVAKVFWNTSQITWIISLVII